MERTQHGTRSGYNHYGCRCVECREANRLYCTQWRREHSTQSADHLARSRAKRRAIIEAAKALPCLDCGEQYPSRAMDLHHRDPSTKAPVQMARLPIRDVINEIAKCDVLCAVCHRLRH